MRRAPYEIRVRFGATKRVGVEHVKREAVRRCRAMTLHLGAGASGEVKRQGLGRIYSCFAVKDGDRLVVRGEVA